MHCAALSVALALAALAVVLVLIQPVLTTALAAIGLWAYRECHLHRRLCLQQEQLDLQKRCRSLAHNLRAEIADLKEAIERQTNSPLSDALRPQHSVIRSNNGLILPTKRTAGSRRPTRRRAGNGKLGTNGAIEEATKEQEQHADG